MGIVRCHLRFFGLACTPLINHFKLSRTRDFGRSGFVGYKSLKGRIPTLVKG